MIIIFFIPKEKKCLFMEAFVQENKKVSITNVYTKSFTHCQRDAVKIWMVVI